ncbi:exported hypothetical protein [Streptomyces misionensis JCM 4497]
MPSWVRSKRTCRAPSGSSMTSWARSSSPGVTPVAVACAKAAVRAALTTAVSALVADATERASPVVAGPAKAVPARPVAAVVTATATATERMCGLRNLIRVPSVEGGWIVDRPVTWRDRAPRGLVGPRRVTLTDQSCARKAGMIHFAIFYGNPLQTRARE